MIGCGLALNDTRFILIQATCPTSSFSRSETILEPRYSKFAMGLQTSRNKKGVLKALSDSERALSIGTYALCSFRVLELLCYSSS